MFLKKTPEQIINQGLDLLVENTPIDNLHRGAIARTIIESFAYELGSDSAGLDNFYDIAEFILNNAFLSKADSRHLELIGELLDYPRREEEVYDEVSKMYLTRPITDDAYKYEISRRVHTIASSNEEALRLALMAVNGVQDVVGEEYTHGTGSFTFLVIPMAGYSNVDVMGSCQEVVRKTKAFGIKYEIKMPREVSLDFNLQLVMKESATETDKVNAVVSVRSSITSYLLSYTTGQMFIYNDFVQEVMNSDEKIIDFKVLSFYMDGEPVLLTNQTVADDERVRPGIIQIV